MSSPEQKSFMKFIMWVLLLCIIGAFLWYHSWTNIGILVGGFLIGAIMGVNAD